MHKFSLLLLFSIGVCNSSLLSQVIQSNINLRVIDRPLVVAHRGAWRKSGLPENSLAALKQAIKIGCDFSETDVHLTADKVLVINHDATFYGMTIEQSTYEQLLSAKLPNGESIPTLQSFLDELLQQERTQLLLEPKPSIISVTRSLELADSVVSLVIRNRARERVDYISFSYSILKRIKLRDNEAEVGFLNGNITAQQLNDDGIKMMAYNISVYQQKGSLIDEAKSARLITNCWTINDATTMKWLIDRKVDLITTGEPELLKTLIQYPIPVCAGGATIITSELTGNSFQWQLNTGNGFSNLIDDNFYLGSISKNLSLINVPSSINGYLVRCIVDGKISDVYKINVINYWKGSVSDDWENPVNWSCSTLPDENTDVVIATGNVIVNSPKVCRKVTIANGANLTIKPGSFISITNRK